MKTRKTDPAQKARAAPTPAVRVKSTKTKRVRKRTSQLEAIFLSILINQERYGRQVSAEYFKRTGQELSLGSLYTTLNRMVDCGLVKSRPGAASERHQGNRRRYFRITASGHQALDAYEIWAINAMGTGVRHA